VTAIAQLRNSSDHCQMSQAETIGQRIKRERLNRRLTQRELADAVDDFQPFTQVGVLRGFPRFHLVFG